MSTDDITLPTLTREDWMSRGACRGADTAMFFAERGESTKEAKAVCAGCTVRDECLDYALRNGDKFGIWGGTSERERRRMRRESQMARHQVRYDYDEVAAVAFAGQRQGIGATSAVADRYRMSPGNARNLLNRARSEGHAIPYDYRRSA